MLIFQISKNIAELFRDTLRLLLRNREMADAYREQAKGALSGVGEQHICFV
ncbi:hypothetical protein HMPREF1981_01857 [Bacteroides pyogenes F0041]|uniref:Uncharacterized protein n=1 Tax=Bacteroides pyogenes F0041 TaxID=1321819 RepID=U2CL90_9BACE|nr:hypothetical protein HMPREF1981_01857 [Bacteroides pyogenes F0041]GAE22751.1 hypothetical protein JCM10003_2396 [Bacteroides pyogenes JCM 10003]